jgi:hypothetical protein
MLCRQTGGVAMNRFGRTVALALVLGSVGIGCTSKPGVGPAKGAIVLPFIENDFAQAIAVARKENLPLFVEVWAPW